MKLKKSDIQLIIGIAFALMAVAFYLYCSNSLAAKTDALTRENDSLQTEVDYLQDLMNHKQEYIDETENMSVECTEIMGEFPADVKAETQIMYANNLETSNAIKVESVEMPGKEMVVVESAAPAQPAADAQPVDDTQPVNDAVDTNVNNSASALTTSVLLYRNPTTITFKSTYKSAKDIIKIINEDTKDKKSIEALTLAFDEETGNLSGTIIIEMYSLTGTDAVFVEPSVTGIKNGSPNIFKSSENTAALYTTTTAADGGTEGSGEDAADNAEGDTADTNN